jgi:hypothetical protein
LDGMAENLGHDTICTYFSFHMQRGTVQKG